jgi:hypothetical protein
MSKSRMLNKLSKGRPSYCTYASRQPAVASWNILHWALTSLISEPGLLGFQPGRGLPPGEEVIARPPCYLLLAPQTQTERWRRRPDASLMLIMPGGHERGSLLVASWDPNLSFPV